MQAHPVYAQVRSKQSASFRRQQRRNCRSLDDILEDGAIPPLLSDNSDAFLGHTDSSVTAARHNIEPWIVATKTAVSSGLRRGSSPSSSFKKAWKSTDDLQDTYVEIQNDFSSNHVTPERNLSMDISVDGKQSNCRDSGCFSDPALNDSASIYMSMDVDPGRLMQSRASMSSLTPSISITENDPALFGADGSGKNDVLCLQRQMRASSSKYPSMDRDYLRRVVSEELPTIPTVSFPTKQENLYDEVLENLDTKPLNILQAKSPTIKSRFGKASSSDDNLTSALSHGGSKHSASQKHSSALKKRFGGLLKSKLPNLAKVENCPKVEQACIRTTPLPPIPIASYSAGVIEDQYACIIDNGATCPTAVTMLSVENDSSKKLTDSQVAPVKRAPSPIVPTPLENPGVSLRRSRTPTDFSRRSLTSLQSPTQNRFSTGSFPFDETFDNLSFSKSGKPDHLMQRSRSVAPISPLVTQFPNIHPSFYQTPQKKSESVESKPKKSEASTLPRPPKVEYHNATLSRFRKEKIDTRSEEEKLEELDALLQDFETSLDDISFAEDSNILNDDPLNLTRGSPVSKLNQEDPLDSVQFCSSDIIQKSNPLFRDPVEFYQLNNIPLTLLDESNAALQSAKPLYSEVQKQRPQTIASGASNGKKSFSETDDYAEITEDDLYNMPKRKSISFQII